MKWNYSRTSFFANNDAFSGKKLGNRAKPLDIRANNGKNIFGQKTSAPPPRTKFVPYTVRPNKKETRFISEISSLPRKIETNCMLHYQEHFLFFHLIPNT